MKDRGSFWLGYSSGAMWAVAITVLGGMFGNAVPAMIGVSIGAVIVAVREVSRLPPQTGSDE